MQKKIAKYIKEHNLPKESYDQWLDSLIEELGDTIFWYTIIEKIETDDDFALEMFIDKIAEDILRFKEIGEVPWITGKYINLEYLLKRHEDRKQKEKLAENIQVCKSKFLN